MYLKNCYPSSQRWIYYGSFSPWIPASIYKKNANSDTFPSETEASYLQCIPAFSKHFRNCPLSPTLSHLTNVIWEIHAEYIGFLHPQF